MNQEEKAIDNSECKKYVLAKSYYADGSKDKALKHLEIGLNVWENADIAYKPAIEARLKWAQWNEVN